MMRRQSAALIFLILASGCSCATEADKPAPTAEAKLPPVPAAQRTTEQTAEVRDARNANSSAATPQKQSPAKENSELKSRFGRSIMESLDSLSGVSDEDRDRVRSTLRENDEELHRNLGENLRRKIEAANNTHGGPRRIAIPAP